MSVKTKNIKEGLQYKRQPKREKQQGVEKIREPSPDIAETAKPKSSLKKSNKQLEELQKQRDVHKLSSDNADLLKKMLARRGINIESLGHGTQKLKIDNPDEEVEKVEQKLLKTGLYDKLDKVLREACQTTLNDVLKEAKGERIHDGRIGSVRVELKAAYDLANNFPRAVKQMIQDGILQKQGKAVVRWFINTGARNMLYEHTRAKFDVARNLIIRLARLLGVPVEETTKAEFLMALKRYTLKYIVQAAQR